MSSIPSAKKTSGKETNMEVVCQDEQSQSPISHGLPVILTWTNTIRCNARCQMCYISRDRSIPRDCPSLSIEKLHELAPSFFPYLVRLNLTRRGETFVDPLFRDIVNLVAQYGTKVDINTNGMLMDYEWSCFLIPHLFDVKVSYDGATKETFETIRKGTSFDRVRKNVVDFVRARDEYRKQRGQTDLPTITLEVVLRRDNIQEFPTIIEQAADLGVDRVKGYHLFAFHKELSSLSLVHYKEFYNRIYQECQSTAKKLGISLLMAEPFMVTPGFIEIKHHPCPYLWRKMWVDFNGDVLACISHPKRNVVGNIYKESLEAIWNSPTYQTLRKDEDPMCHSCGYRVEVPSHQPLPYDDDYLTHAGEILKAYQENKCVVEKPVGMDWKYLWCRRTAQMPLPSDWSHLSRW